MRKYTRLTPTKWSLDNLSKAMEAVLSKKMGYKKSSDLYHVPKTTLIRYIKKYKTANETEPLLQDYPNKSEGTPKRKTETLSSAEFLRQHSSLCQPPPPKVQKKPKMQYGNEFFEERRQMASTQSTMRVAPSLSSRTQMQHLPVNALSSATTQPVSRQVQVMAPPKPIEKPKPRKKQLFVIADHQRGVMCSLATLWKTGKLCDAGIGNGSSTVRVHKVVLSAVCPKLLSVFSADFFSQKFLQVNFPEEVSTEALKAFAEYMYRGLLDLDHDILEQLKIIARKLDMKEFEEMCDSHLPKHRNQNAFAAATSSITDVPLIQTTMPIPAMTSSHASFGSNVSTSMQSAPSINTQVIDIKQEISDAELVQIQNDAAAIFGHESAPVAPKKSKNTASFVINPNIKTEVVGPEDDKYGQWCGSSGNQAFTSTPSSSSSIETAVRASTSLASVPQPSTEFAAPFSATTNDKSTKLKVTQSYDTPLVSDLDPASGIVETVPSQSTPVNGDFCKPSSRQAASTFSIDGPSTSTNNDGVFPVALFTAGRDSLPLLTTPTVDINAIDLYDTDLT